ncbi:ABC transporter-like [Theobroma cacao]|nr:ABC transporter-like [Theobroma cacao]
MKSGEAGDLHELHQSSLRRYSPSVASSRNASEVFSMSLQDDEEALKWAALERLPTYERLKKGLLQRSRGQTSEIEVKNLTFHERVKTVERLFKSTEEDNESFLLQLRNRIDRVGIELPRIEVRFEQLNVCAEAYVGSRALPSFFNFYTNMVESFLSYLRLLPSRKKQISILEGVTGILKPCSPVIRPFNVDRLKNYITYPITFSGICAKSNVSSNSNYNANYYLVYAQLEPDVLFILLQNQFSGRVTYNGHDLREFVPQKSAAYISQHDLHIPEMTVRETLAFSARCQGAGSQYDMLVELLRREKAANIKPDPDVDIFMKAAATEGQEMNIVVDYVLKILGLEVCADTLVGDGMLRGISGGQKKRLTTGEMLVGPAKVLLMDEISTGLDSSTTFQVVNALKNYVHVLDGTALISLLQPQPETYDLFDDIILLSDGQIVYQGPREHVLEFFESMGFRCPERKGVADFLQEVTSKKDQGQYWARENEPYRYVTIKEFVQAFKSFHVSLKLKTEISAPFDRSKSHRAALTTQKYGVGKKELFNACMSRELLLTKRNSFVIIFKLIQLLVTAFVTMTVFLRTEMHRDSQSDGGIFMGSLFFILYVSMFNGFSETSMTIAKLPVFYKQRAFLLYPPWAYALPSWSIRLPISLIEVAVFVFPIYYVIGYDPNVGRTPILGNTFAALGLIIYIVFGGFVLSKESVKKWWIWVYWSSPMMYAQNALAVNEFLGESWRHPVRKGNDEIRRVSSTITSTENFETNAGVPQRRRRRGMVLPFEQFWITFDAIRYFVDMPQEMKNQGVNEDRLELLKGVSGTFRPSILTALMGVSGAGKTTLMDVLAGRKTDGYIQGSITISGYQKKQETFTRIFGYCEQNDIHSPHVTIYESLIYSAWLRLPPEVDSGTRKLQMFIEEVMELMELSPLRDAMVGLPGVNGLSLEQRKRLTVAVELMANPSIIFMDEPTSGLDARAAAIVMRTIRNTVDTGRTVVCTIHQPSIEIFEAFDELFLMARGGQEIYAGPLGHHSFHLIKYFEEIEGISKIKDGYNPATWVLEVTTSAQSDLGIDLNDVYRKSELYRRNKALIKELSIPAPGTKELYFPTKYSQSFLTQWKACLWKQNCSYWRNTAYTAFRLLFTAFLALVYGSMFWDLGSKSFLVIPVVGIERTVFYRERAAGMYSSLAYSLAQVVIELPYLFILAIAYGVIIYAMIGFEWNATKFFWYMFFMFFNLLDNTIFAMMLVALTPNQQVAYIVSTAIYSLWNLFAGFIIPRPRIPVWWRWYSWTSPLAWTLYGLIASQFGDVKDMLDTNETVQSFIRSHYGFRHDFIGVVAAAIVAFAVFFALIFSVSIKVMNFQRR